MPNPWKHLIKNVQMSSEYGAAGAREEKNPKLSGRKRNTKQSTKRHSITITIDDLKELWRIQNGKCFWLGIDMSLEDLFVSYSPFAVSVERLDSNRGYHKDNIALTTRFANRGRGKYDNENFKQRLDDLLENRSKEDIKIHNFVPTIRGNLTEFFN